MLRPLSSSLLTAPNHLHPHISYAERTPSGHFFEVSCALHVGIHVALLMLSAYGRNGPACSMLQAVLKLPAHMLVGLHADMLAGLHANMVVELHADMLVGLLLHVCE